LPGLAPAHADKRAAEPNRLISVPISASICQAPVTSMPGMLSICSICGCKGSQGGKARIEFSELRLNLIDQVEGPLNDKAVMIGELTG
jgi:hypothetical protein